KLSTLGIPTKLVVDSAASGILREVQLVLVGGDAVGPQGLINKIGTYGLAVVAHSLSVPLYALCDTTKFLPAGYSLASEVARDPREVLAMPLQGVKALNYYFDSTPLSLLTGLVTEERILRSPELEKLFTPGR
ncbi:MAG: translation initiation factor eIF-2B, partial [Bacteroidota bacterium]